MAIDLASILKQIARDGSQGASGNSFFYLLDASDIDFKVNGFITSSGVSGPNAEVENRLGNKYIVLDESGLTNAAIGSGIRSQGISNNDIIEKRGSYWGIHMDASLTGNARGASGGALAYSVPEKSYYYYDSTGWKKFGTGSVDVSSLTAGFGIGISGTASGVLAFNNLGVTGITIPGQTTALGLSGTVGLSAGVATNITLDGNRIVISVDTGALGGSFNILDQSGNSDQVNLNSTLTFTGGAGMSVVASDNKLTFNSIINGATNGGYFEYGTTGSWSFKDNSSFVARPANAENSKPESFVVGNNGTIEDLYVSLPGNRVNLIKHSQDWVTSSWNRYNGKEVVDQINTDVGWPLGGTGGIKVVFDDGDGDPVGAAWSNGIYQLFFDTTTNGAVTGQEYTLSCWAQRAPENGDHDLKIRLSYYSASIDGSIHSQPIPVGNTPERVSFSFVSVDGNQLSNVAIGNDHPEGQAGAGSTGAVYLWGIQLERGTEPTNYIRTFGATASASAKSVRVSSSFYGLTGVTSGFYPAGLSSSGITGDRLVVATGPSSDPFRTYVKFGNAWVQTGVVGVGQGPVGPTGAQGTAGNKGDTGDAGISGYNSGILVPFNSTEAGLSGLSFGASSLFFINAYEHPGLSAASSFASLISPIRGQTIIARNERNSDNVVVFRATGAVNFVDVDTNIVTTSLNGSYVLGNSSTFSYPGATGGLLLTFLPDGIRGTTGSTGQKGATGDVGYHLSLLNTGVDATDQLKFVDANNIGFTGVGADDATLLNFMMAQVTGGNPVTITFDPSSGNKSDYSVFYATGESKVGTYQWEFAGNYLYGNQATIGNSSTPVSIHFTINGKSGLTASAGFATSWGVTASGGPLNTGATAGQIWVLRNALPENISAVYMPPFDRFEKSLTGLYEKVFSVGGTGGNPLKGTLYVTREDQGAVGATNDTFIFNVTSVGTIVPGRHTQLSGNLVAGSTGMFGNANMPGTIRTRFTFVPAGARGETGTVSLSGYSTYYGFTHDTGTTFDAYTNQRGRKYLYMTEDGGITWDYIRPYDIYNQKDFEYDALSFSFNGATTRRISNSTYSLSLNTLSATYRVNNPTPGGTAHVVVSTSGIFDEGTAFPLRGNNPGSTSFDLSSASISGTGGSDRSVTLTLTSTGQDFDGSIAQSNPRNITIILRNDFLYGLTNASYLTGGNSETGIDWSGGVGGRPKNGLSADYGLVSSYPRNEVIDGFNKTVTTAETGLVGDYYIYIAYPARLHVEGISTRLGSSTANLGGMKLQGNELLDIGPGVSTIDFTNEKGYTEKYKIWRSEQRFSASDKPSFFMGIYSS